MNIPNLRDFTSARVALGRSGNSLPTTELLDLQLAHVRAREAVHSNLDIQQIGLDLKLLQKDVLFVHSAARDRTTYVRRPDLGRTLDGDSRAVLRERKSKFAAAFIIADGLSAIAVHRHAPKLLAALFPLLNPVDWNLAPLIVAEQARVAIADDIGDSLGADCSVVLIGERPGLSASDSLGVYLTWQPRPGLTDAARNCISNIREEGLSYEAAAHTLSFLMHESRRRKLSGIRLKADTVGLDSGANQVPSNKA